MCAKASKGGAGNAEFEALAERYRKLNESKVRAEENLNNAQKRLEELQHEAREAYGTDDPGELEAMLAKMEAENASKTAAYAESLDAIEKDLADLESSYEKADREEDEDEADGE